MSSHDHLRVAQTIERLLPDNRWEGAVMAKALGLTLLPGGADAAVALMRQEIGYSKKRAVELVGLLPREGVPALLPERERTGSSENPITKMFPAAIAETLFLESIRKLCAERPTVHYRDHRRDEHSNRDFTLTEGVVELPINVKNAGTRFENAAALVGLPPDDCLPIPVYKAYGAASTYPALIYVFNVDYGLLEQLEHGYVELLSPEEQLVWKLLNEKGGKHLKKGEDEFVYGVVERRWSAFRKFSSNHQFEVVSAQKALKILHSNPRRTPGVGLRAWGNMAKAEVNVHLQRSVDMTPWSSVYRRIRDEGVACIVADVVRTCSATVPDPRV